MISRKLIFIIMICFLFISLSPSVAFAEFQISNINSNSPVEEGDTAFIDVTITNNGVEKGTQSIFVDVFGQNYFEEKNVTLEPQESNTLTYEWKNTKLGTHRIFSGSFDDSKTYSLEVVGEVDPSFFEVLNLSINRSDYTKGETLKISATAKNTGGKRSTKEVSLKINNSIYQTKNVFLEKQEEKTIEFTWTPNESKNYNVEISTEDSKSNINITVISDDIEDNGEDQNNNDSENKSGNADNDSNTNQEEFSLIDYVGEPPASLPGIWLPILSGFLVGLIYVYYRY